MDEAVWRNLVMAADPDGFLDAALLLRRTGAPLAAWTRAAVPVDVVCVMAATLVGSVETMVEAVHGASPQSIRMESDQCQMLATKVDPRTILALITPSRIPEARIRQMARVLTSQLTGSIVREPRRTAAVTPTA
jgi:predicted regulator of Ras-like GTPase activity (Roadblock/LC7/MglB family)